MYIVFVIAVFINTVNSDDLMDNLTQYFESDDVEWFRNKWDNYRAAMEKAIAAALQESTGRDLTNLFVTNPAGLRLAKGYFHQHGPVQILLKDLDLSQFPKCLLPDVSISLASNVVKIETKLSKMVINAWYTLLRNISDVTNEVNNQDPYKISPFLFQNVEAEGKVTLSVDECMLSGYVIARLTEESVNLGHYKFTLTNCDYTAEIHQPGDMSPPVIAPFSTKKDPSTTEIKHLLLKPISVEVIQKLQQTIFHFINTKAIFSNNLHLIRQKQTEIFSNTLDNLTKLIRDVNLKIIRNNPSWELEDFAVTWDDVMPNNVDQLSSDSEKSNGGIRLDEMLLSGLDTAYISNTGGPYKLDEVMIGEMIRFSTLQIRGIIYNKFAMYGSSKFSVEFSDYDVNIEMFALRKNDIIVDTAGYRKMEFAEPASVHGSAKELITGYLMNEIPSVIQNILRKALGNYNMPLQLKLSEQNYSDNENKSDALSSYGNSILYFDYVFGKNYEDYEDFMYVNTKTARTLIKKHTKPRKFRATKQRDRIRKQKNKKNIKRQ